MGWLYERRVVDSEKNGRIICERRFGDWKIMVGGAHETSGYLLAMWRDSLSRLPSHWPARRILMLGLAAGGNLRPFQARFPGAAVTAVEWDPAMIRIFRELGPKDVPAPEIIEGGAAEIVRRLEGPYDLIVVDLFTGPDVNAPLSDPAFMTALRRLLAPTGFLITNLYKQPELLRHLNGAFEAITPWRWKFNTLALAQPPLPDGYVPYQADDAFLARDFAGDGRYRPIGDGGVVWSFGPLRFAKWYGDAVPSSAEPGSEVHGSSEPGSKVPGSAVPGTKGTGRRLRIWQPIRGASVPKGWYRLPNGLRTNLTGFVPLSPDFETRWTPHARRHLKRWRGQEAFEVFDDPAPDALRRAYERSDLPMTLKPLFVDLLRTKIARHGERVRLFGVRRRGGLDILGGFAAVDLPETRQSVHLLSFMTREAGAAGGGYALVERWMRHGLTENLAFMDFDRFWAPGDPKSWKGFSKFKSQFGVRFVRYPAALIKLSAE